MRRCHRFLWTGLLAIYLLGIGWPLEVPAQPDRGETAGQGAVGRSGIGQAGTGQADAGRVDVFFTGARPVTVSADLRRRLSAAGIRLFLHDLDAPGRLEMELSQGLPADHQAALAVARQRLAMANQDGALARRLASAYQGLTVALELGVERLPAVVFGAGGAKGSGVTSGAGGTGVAGGAAEPVVVYGVDDLGVAVGLYLDWREGRIP